MKKFALGLISAAALATTVLLVRQQREVDPKVPQSQWAPERTPPTQLSIERLREVGL
jgi:hypothetical protein